MQHVGGGALIGNRWVLTSGTALEGIVTPSTIVVVLGMIDSQTTIVAPGFQTPAYRIHRHDNFNDPFVGANE
jgi:secreted trypsin-like serine protease